MMPTFEYTAVVRVITDARNAQEGEEIVREQLEQTTFDIESIEEVR
jgi:hypothetical protein